MKVIDVHPEELFDKDARGELTEGERVRLGAHVERCAVCRFDRQVRDDLSAELSSAESLPRMRSLVDGALRQSRALESLRPAASDPRGAHGSRRRYGFLLLAATFVFGTGVAAAESGVATHLWGVARDEVRSVFRSSSASAPAPSGSPSGGNRKSPSGSERTPESASESPVASEVSEVMATPPDSTSAMPVAAVVPMREEAPLPVVPRIDARPQAKPIELKTSPALPAAESAAVRSDRAVSEGAVGRENVAASSASSTEYVEPRPAVVEPSVRLPESASTLFERANEARRAGRLADATSFYEALEGRFPGSSEAKLSLVVLARLRLDRGELDQALGGFDAYLRSGGTELREEAMAGRAMALERLGRSADERRAWSDLLRAYPGTSYGRIARVRLPPDGP